MNVLQALWAAVRCIPIPPRKKNGTAVAAMLLLQERELGGEGTVLLEHVTLVG